MLRLGQEYRQNCRAAADCAPWRLIGFSWLLMAAVALHAAFSPTASWALAAAGQSEEESEQREPPTEEALAGALGAAPPRGPGLNRARASLWSVWLEERYPPLEVSAAAPPPPAEQSSRNGVGGPLRC